ncbi:Rha family transcriptional regulator [Janthinobacterium sp. LB2P10]|uniref:Rha family transcriptional regulator n=1 Tax=Janthinobacterium sp. LB2P10 TaxID=3424194 RepID=UPI003F266ED3
MNTTTLRTKDQADHSLVSMIGGKIATTSNVIAATFGKLHKVVLRAIKSLECSAEFTGRNFVPSEYFDSTGRKLPSYIVTKDGFSMLAMGFTGKEATKWKEAYINAFNLMDSELRRIGEASKQSDKHTRVPLKDAINMLVARSKHLNYSDAYKMVHQRFGIETVEEFSDDQVPLAVEYVHKLIAQWELVEPELLAAPVKNELSEGLRNNIGAMANHMLWLHSWWMAHGPAIEAMNGQTARAVRDHFVDGASVARNVAYTIGEAPPEEFMKNYPWKGDDSERRHYRSRMGVASQSQRGEVPA